MPEPGQAWFGADGCFTMLHVCSMQLRPARHMTRAVAPAESLDCALVTDARISRAPGLRCPVTVVPR